MGNTNHSFLFIPDISGFTEFEKQTEINHSRHIISELQELIIDSDQLGMTVAEIEGDAVIFCKSDSVPSLAGILQQAEEMFLKFHTHLKRYENERICQCGACRNVANLSLKIIAHASKIESISVEGSEKPYEQEVILVHKLLKNQIKSNEYLLMTKQLFENSDELESISEKDWVLVNSGRSVYEDLGTVDYKFIPFKSLRDRVVTPAKVEYPEKSENPISKRIFIDCDVDTAYEVISNFDFRSDWNKKIKDIKYEKNKINRIGTNHVCMLKQGKSEFETITNDFGQDKIVYGERLKKFGLAKDLTTYFILEPKNSGTHFTFEAHIIPRPLTGWIVSPLIKRLFFNGLYDQVHNIKIACENFKDLLKKQQQMPAATQSAHT